MRDDLGYGLTESNPKHEFYLIQNIGFSESKILGLMNPKHCFYWIESKMLVLTRAMTRVKNDIKEKSYKIKKVGMIDGFIFHKSEKCADIGS